MRAAKPQDWSGDWGMREGREVGGGEVVVWARGVRVRERGRRRGGERGGCGTKVDVMVGAV